MEAEVLLKELLEREVTDCEVWSLLGQVYLRTERLRLAEEAFNESLSECSNLASAHRGLLTIYEITDRVEEAEIKREGLSIVHSLHRVLLCDISGFVHNILH